VTVADDVMGLEIGITLKGLNFRDQSSQNYDKNLTGRMYELADEVRVVHEHLPHAFMAGVFFLPIDAASDKISGNSSFANAVLKLRARTGRLDAMLSGHASRCDVSYVALYCLGNETVGGARGVVRFLNVEKAPPQRGSPQVRQTQTLSEVIDEIVLLATNEASAEWSDAESEA